MDRYRKDIIDLLSNGPSSFAALYRFVLHGASESTVTVRGVMSSIESLEMNGIVHRGMMMDDGMIHDATAEVLENAVCEYEQWLEPQQRELTTSDVSLDEVGVWLELQPQVAIEPVDASSFWTLDVDTRNGLVTVQAADEDSARAQLHTWAQRSGAMLHLNTVRSENGVELQGTTGTRYRGTRLICEFSNTRARDVESGS